MQGALRLQYSRPYRRHQALSIPPLWIPNVFKRPACSTCHRAPEPPRQTFLHQQMLADSGFAVSDQMVPMFRKTSGSMTMRRCPAYFNTIAAIMRYQVEQAIGILKSRWKILRSMPLRLRTTHDQALAHGIIVACIILHNLVVNTEIKPQGRGREKESDPRSALALLGGRDQSSSVVIWRSVSESDPD